MSEISKPKDLSLQKLDQPNENNENNELQEIIADYSSSEEDSTKNGSKNKKTKKKIQIQVPSSYLQYKIKPQVVGAKKEIIFYNSSSPLFYERKIEKPNFVVWILMAKKKYSYSTKRLIEEGHRMNIQIVVKETSKFDMIIGKNGYKRLYYEKKKCELPDAAMSRIGASIDYFSLSVIRYLENSGIVIINDNQSLLNSRDKLLTTELLAKNGLPIPKTMFVKLSNQNSNDEMKNDENKVENEDKVENESINKKNENENENEKNKNKSDSDDEEIDYSDDIQPLTKQLNFPIILKKASGSQGKGVLLVKNQQDLDDVMDMIDKRTPMIFQEFISQSSGKDLRIIVIGGKPIGAMMRIAKKGNFKANFHQGGYVKSVDLSETLEWLSIEVANIIGLDISGIDVLIGEESYYVCEVNASPGFEGFELSTGINVAKSILQFIKNKVTSWRLKFNTLKYKKKRKKEKMVLIPVDRKNKTSISNSVPI